MMIVAVNALAQRYDKTNTHEREPAPYLFKVSHSIHQSMSIFLFCINCTVVADKVTRKLGTTPLRPSLSVELDE